MCFVVLNITPPPQQDPAPHRMSDAEISLFLNGFVKQFDVRMENTSEREERRDAFVILRGLLTGGGGLKEDLVRGRLVPLFVPSAPGGGRGG